MSDPIFVWAKDTLTGSAGPVSRAVAEAFAGRYRVDDKHPTHDTLGQLLPVKAAEPKLSTPKLARKPVTKPRARKPATRTKPAQTADPTPEEA